MQKVEPKPIAEEPPKNSINISKVMLNVNETEATSREYENSKTDNHVESVVNSDAKSPCDRTSICDENLSNSKIQVKYSSDEKTVEGNKTKPKKVSVVDFRISSAQEPELDQNDISKQVNEIIDEAVKINEAKLNAKNERKNEENNEAVTKTNEINNNNTESISEHTTSKKETWASSQLEINSNISKPIAKRSVSPEVPIQPILNEVRTFDFQEYSDNSLPASTTSTLNTAETPSTGPESLITSDIEDGYKGNEVEKKRKTETTYDESKEEFIESQFGFLSEHLDSKMNGDSDDEKTIGSIKTANIVSSTMINDKFGDTFKVSPTVEKRDVIDELTQIINCNRLETCIKPNNDTNKLIETGKRSSLTNFHIGAYSNSINDNNNTYTINGNASLTNQNTTKSVENSNQSQDDSIKISTNSNHDMENDSETFITPKPVGRSMSFHSTFPGIINRDDNTNNTKLITDLSETSRSFSYISLNGNSKQESNNPQTTATSNFNESARKKSASELSIADTPSLQSIEVMKSILNNSRSMNLECKPETQETIDQDNQRNSHENENKPQNIDMPSTQLRKEPKTWKYQGPPSINVSTWGERPKSMVHIKSDNDYIFGGSSKMAALQKRFSGLDEEQNQRNVQNSVGKSIQKPIDHCDNNSCKLPIVRGVEYKKNIPLNNTDSTTGDTQDSVQRSFRPSYEISCIISQKQPPEKMRTAYATMTLNRMTKSNHSTDSVPAKSILKSSSMLRSQSVDVQPEMQPKTVAKNNKPHGEQRVKDTEIDTSTKKLEKPMFSQFTLRKTGLKEKILDESNVKNGNSLTNHNDCTNKKTMTEPKVNVIPTAPKPAPPPMPKKPLNRPLSMGHSVADPRSELLNSIRSFNRDALKRNCIY